MNFNGSDILYLAVFYGLARWADWLVDFDHGWHRYAIIVPAGLAGWFMGRTRPSDKDSGA